MMSYFATTVFLCVSILFVCVGYKQSGLVSWATDKCGCIGVWGLFMASVVVLCAMLVGQYVTDAVAWQVLAFAVWVGCRAAKEQHKKHGVFGKTDKSPLGEK
jgi:hypothetical protein